MNQPTTAVLLMDLMPIVVPTFGGDDELLANAAKAAEHARTSGMSVIHVRLRFRDGYPEVEPTNKIFGPLSENMDFTEDNPDTSVHEAVRAESSDILVTKRRVSAFSGSDLDLVLRARGVHKVVLAGVATSGVVLSTLRQAADLDYQVAVLADACADGDPEVHAVLLGKVFPQQADVLTTDEWIATT